MTPTFTARDPITLKLGRFSGVLLTMLRPTRLWPLVCLFSLASFGGSRAADTRPSLLGSPVTIAPLPALVAHAEAQKIPLRDLEVPRPPGSPKAGDRIVTVISLHDGARERQWLASFEIAPPTAKESATSQKSTMVMSIGKREHTFSTSGSMPLEISTAGPFVTGTKQSVAEKNTRTLISPEFLALGLDRACALFLKFEKTETKTQIVLPEADERIVAGLMPALMAFFQALQQTPALKEIVWEIIDLPSAWSILKRGGKIEPGFNLTTFASINPAEWGLTDRPCYRMDLSLALNDQPALECALFVTAPHPPLLTSAGIVGIIATRPGKQDKRIDIRVVSARPAATVAP